MSQPQGCRPVVVKLILATALLCTGLLPIAEACQICVPFPTKSAADYLIEADAVVLAREDPERPFHFSATRVLKGRPGAEKIDLFLDSTTRRILKAFPERSVVLARGAGNDPPEWRRIGMTHAGYEVLVGQILSSAPAWEITPRQRVEFFSELLGHEDRQISTLAHLEVGRAPYSQIKSLKGVLPRDEMHLFLKNIRYLEWHALYILLLAQSEDERDREFIFDSLQSAARFGMSNQLAAWATAAIELDGDRALDFVEAQYLRNTGRTAAELKEISMALSVHGTNGHTHLRDRIVDFYGILLADHPGMTPDIANDLIAWNRTELSDEISRYLADNPRRFDLQTTLRLRAYCRRARPKK